MGVVSVVKNDYYPTYGTQALARAILMVDDENFPIVGIDGIGRADLAAAVHAGGRFVFFEWCVSLGVVTLRRPSAIYFLTARQHGWLRGLPYALASLILGWWAIPWGPIFTPLCILTNLGGGRNVTMEVLSRLRRTSYDN